jgi:hypothetical protein
LIGAAVYVESTGVKKGSGLVDVADKIVDHRVVSVWVGFACIPKRQGGCQGSGISNVVEVYGVVGEGLLVTAKGGTNVVGTVIGRQGGSVCADTVSHTAHVDCKHVIVWEGSVVVISVYSDRI